MADPVVVRVAPSPTGDPHVGTAYVSLFNLALRRKRGGRFILRIDDTDRTRYQADSEAAIKRELGWLGLEWDEGPIYQSERTDRYREACEDLIARGAAYRCDCTAERLTEVREGQKARKETMRYDGHCRERNLPADTTHVVRLKVPRPGETTFTDGIRGPISRNHDEVDDQVLLKSDNFPTYHLATVVDDHDFGVTHILRAEEWISSMPKHVLLYRAIWLGHVPEHWHLPLLRDPDQARRSPSDAATRRSRGTAKQGFLPEAMVNFLARMGFTIGEEREVFSYDEFIEAFDLGQAQRDRPGVRPTEAGVVERRATSARLDDGELANRLADISQPRPRVLSRQLVPLVKERLKRLTDFNGVHRRSFSRTRWTCHTTT